MTATLRSVLVILNRGSGAGGADGARESITIRLQQSPLEVECLTLDEEMDLAAEVRRRVEQGVSLVIAGGGDGTVNAVANAIRDLPVRFGVLPLGTLNHFARDLGIPLDLEAALEVIVAGHSTVVDAVDVNGRLFVNNSSVGLYPRIVRLRERYQRRRASKWLVAAWATLRVLRTGRPLRVQLSVEGAQVMRSTPLVFIGNNAYRMAGFDAGSR